jgi:hypothetical protein
MRQVYAVVAVSGASMVREMMYRYPVWNRTFAIDGTSIGGQLSRNCLWASRIDRGSKMRGFEDRTYCPMSRTGCETFKSRKLRGQCRMMEPLHSLPIRPLVR